MKSIVKAIATLEAGLQRVEKKLGGVKGLLAEKAAIEKVLTDLRPLVKDVPSAAPKARKKAPVK